mmetsp:Transcript_21955/g.61059  ORF Transcript_21955/g.61059 Transcript_21955/m.61059 type:complete len:316 (-) Transcript_21955:1683-2630(-)
MVRGTPNWHFDGNGQSRCREAMNCQKRPRRWTRRLSIQTRHKLKCWKSVTAAYRPSCIHHRKIRPQNNSSSNPCRPCDLGIANPQFVPPCWTILNWKRHWILSCFNSNKNPARHNPREPLHCTVGCQIRICLKPLQKPPKTTTNDTTILSRFLPTRGIDWAAANELRCSDAETTFHKIRHGPSTRRHAIRKAIMTTTTLTAKTHSSNNNTRNKRRTAIFFNVGAIVYSDSWFDPLARSFNTSCFIPRSCVWSFLPCWPPSVSIPILTIQQLRTGPFCCHPTMTTMTLLSSQSIGGSRLQSRNIASLWNWLASHSG